MKPQGDSQIAVHCLICLREGHHTPATITISHDGRDYFTCVDHARRMMKVVVVMAETPIDELVRSVLGLSNPSRHAT